MEYLFKMTSELTVEETRDNVSVLNTVFGALPPPGPWGDERFFQWKYADNPYGDSLHVIGYDEGQPVAAMAFWRNDLDDLLAYHLADTAVLPSHQRRGIFQQMEAGCVERVEGAYIYNSFSIPASLAGFFKWGWTVQRKAGVGFHLASAVLRRYRERDPIPDQYAEWRFARHPDREYNICRLKGRPFLVSKKRNWGVYVVVGPVSTDFGLQEVHPPVLFSYDLPDLPFRVPGKVGYFIEKPCYVSYDGFLPSCRSEVL